MGANFGDAPGGSRGSIEALVGAEVMAFSDINNQARQQLAAIVEATYELEETNDISRRNGESDYDYYDRIRRTFGFVCEWSMEGTDFGALAFPGRRAWRGVAYRKYDTTAAYPVPGYGETRRWFDLYVAANACVLLAEGVVSSRFIEDFTIMGDWFDVSIGT